MRRHHIAIFTNLGHGHVYPTLGVCTELVRRDYRVTYVTNEYYSEQIRQTGAEPVIFAPAKWEIPEELKQLRLMSLDDPRQWPIIASFVFPWFIKDAIETLPQVEGFYTEDTPDVILYDRLAFAGRILAKRLDVPAVQLNFTVPPYKNYIVRKNGICSTPEPMWEFSRRLDCYMAENGISEQENLFHVETMNICFIPREFQHHAEWFDNRFRFVGACLNRPFKRTWTRTGVGKSLILVAGLSDGNDVEFFKLVVESLAMTPYHVILSLGKHIEPKSLGELPSNFEINKGTYYLEMLPYVSLTVCHGGVGTILESIYYGVPVICIPTGLEQEDNSYRVVELGLGKYLHREGLTVGLIRDSVADVLGDNQLLDRVKWMQQVFKSSGGAQTAADSIDEFLGVVRPT